jgi:sodium-dependent dicarboxylate transporter 2/3/5
MKFSGKQFGLLLGIILFFIIFLFTELKPGHPEVTRTLAVALLMATWWITEAIPLAVTALLPLILFPLLGILDGKETSEAYINHIIFIFIGGFIMALAMEKWNLHKRIALKILIFTGISPGRILLGFMLATLFLSMWISNTATTMMMIPIVMSIISSLEETLENKSLSKYITGLLLAIAYTASIGGMATLVGTPTNLVCPRILNLLYPDAPDISFARWLFLAMPVTLLMFIMTWLLIFFIYRPREKWTGIDSFFFLEQYKKLGKATYEEKITMALFIIMALLWIFRASITFDSFTLPGWASIFGEPDFINDGTVAMLISVILFIIPSKNKNHERLMDWKTAHRLPWNIVLLFGGGFALARGFQSSGLALWFGEQLSWTKNIHPYLILAIIVAMMSFLTELTSNVASTQMLLPVFASLAIGSGNNPLLFMIPATLASSLAFMLPTATPPNAIIFGTDRIRIQTMVRTGFLLNITGVLVILFIIWLLGEKLFDIYPGIIPEWAAK